LVGRFLTAASEEPPRSQLDEAIASLAIRDIATSLTG
jgi:hypothetical protein